MWETRLHKMSPRPLLVRLLARGWPHALPIHRKDPEARDEVLARTSHSRAPNTDKMTPKCYALRAYVCRNFSKAEIEVKEADMKAKCECCGSGVISIDLQLENGRSFTFTSCGHCEKKSWNSSDGDLSLNRVLQLTASSRTSK